MAFNRLIIVLICCIAGLILGFANPFFASLEKYLANKRCKPYEVHLSFGNSAQEMVVVWRTISDQCVPEVKYGLASDPNTTFAVNGSTYSVTENDMCDAPANSKPFKVNMHKATLPTAVDDALYFYEIGNDVVRYFNSPKLPSSTKSINFVAYADMGEGVVRVSDRKAVDTAHLVQSVHRENSLDFVAHVGDLAYADGKYTVWDSFMRLIEPTASRVPYMIAIGNHEYDYLAGGEKDPSGDVHYEPSWGNFDEGDSGGECGVMTLSRFPMPRAAPVDNPPFWYSFEVGPIHFVVISTEHRVSPGSPQHTWLAAHLAGVDRCRTPWLVVLYHRPMYVVYPHKDNRVVGKHVKEFLEDLLIQHEVDFTISGHVHSYYRTCAVYKNKCTDTAAARGVGKGITHFILGTGGHVLSLIKGKQEPWVLKGLMTWGLGSFNVTGDVMRFKFLVDTNGTSVDEAVVVNKVAGRACPSPSPAPLPPAQAPPADDESGGDLLLNGLGRAAGSAEEAREAKRERKSEEGPESGKEEGTDRKESQDRGVRKNRRSQNQSVLRKGEESGEAMQNLL